jgi:hypothetical protein
MPYRHNAVDGNNARRLGPPVGVQSDFGKARGWVGPIARQLGKAFGLMGQKGLPHLGRKTAASRGLQQVANF